MRPEWPGDGVTDAPEPRRDQRSSYPRQYRDDPQYRDQPQYREQPQPRDRQRREQPSYGERQSRQQQYRHEQQYRQEQQYRGTGAPRASQHYESGFAPTNPFGFAAMVCGGALVLVLIGFLSTILISVPAVLLGGIALWQINTRRERGQWMAITGIILGFVGIVVYMTT
ncbi:MAG: DUF4190 domain-containing protein [Actinobacteria bacterium]|nr:DUF4190 domain-containing protein [Actinomycetota bacterium]MBO0837124.1 DUF4190 domain-containing protein [Actinomycetota bacterium]